MVATAKFDRRKRHAQGLEEVEGTVMCIEEALDRL
jgi:hypothetical protein